MFSVGDNVRVRAESVDFRHHAAKTLRVFVVPKEDGGLPFLRATQSVILEIVGEQHKYCVVPVSDLETY